MSTANTALHVTYNTPATSYIFSSYNFVQDG